MHYLNAHVYCTFLQEAILAIEAQISPPLNVVHNVLIFLLTCACEFDHAHYTPGAVKPIKKFLFQLVPIVD